jgi:HAD superfamily hydrolase (TIGR01509 family)
MNNKHLLIDFDNTMMATEAFALPSLCTRFNALYRTPEPLTLELFQQQFHGLARQSLCAALSQYFGITVDGDALYADREWHVMQHLHSASSGIPMAPGLIETLASLRHAGILAALVSNNPVQRALAAMRYADNKRGDELVTLLGTRMFEAGDKQKPLPDPYMRALSQLDAKPETSWAVEDSVTGVTAARAAGLTVFGYTGFASNPEKARDALKAAGCAAVFATWPEIGAHLTN